MAYGFGSRLIASLERKCGHLAIPGLLRWVGGFQLLDIQDFPGQKTA